MINFNKNHKRVANKQGKPITQTAL